MLIDTLIYSNNWNLEKSAISKREEADLVFLDSKWNTLGVFSATSSDATKSTVIGVDGSNWIRYSTTIATSNAYLSSAHYAQLHFRASGLNQVLCL